MRHQKESRLFDNTDNNSSWQLVHGNILLFFSFYIYKHSINMTGLCYKFKISSVGESTKLIYTVITRGGNYSFVFQYTLLCKIQRSPEICTLQQHSLTLSKLYANCIFPNQIINVTKRWFGPDKNNPQRSFSGGQQMRGPPNCWRLSIHWSQRQYNVFKHLLNLQRK